MVRRGFKRVVTTTVWDFTALHEGMRQVAEKQSRGRPSHIAGAEGIRDKSLPNVVHWYSENSRVLGSTKNFRAVKLKGGAKGWISKGEFYALKEVERLMKSLDGTVAAAASHLSFVDAFEKMTPKQKAEWVEYLNAIDWDAFWQEFYPKEGFIDPDYQDFKVNELMYHMGIIMGYGV